MKKILVANRGEIALRVMRTAKKMGIKTVAIYSTVDRSAPHVRFADEAIHIGENPSSESYLDGERIVQEALKLKVEGIHPGYGFLSENASFAELVEKNGMIFIGPKADSIRVMGDKLAAKDAVKVLNDARKAAKLDFSLFNQGEYIVYRMLLTRSKQHL